LIAASVTLSSDLANLEESVIQPLGHNISMPSPFETDVPNREAAEQAFVAYFTTVTSRTEGELDFESLRSGIIISEALNHEYALINIIRANAARS
jgi:hypothetical protein